MNILEKAILEAGQPLHLEENGFSKSFIFDADFIGFDGHFPDNPILPGVVQLMAGALTASEAAGKHLIPQGVSRTKFLKQIIPNDTITVSGTLKIKNGATLAAITIRSGDDTAATFTLTLTEDQA